MNSEKNTILGATVTGIRNMTKQELNEEGWDFSQPESTIVLVFSDGTILYPSADWEGNGPGVLFGKQGDQGIYLDIPKTDKK